MGLCPKSWIVQDFRSPFVKQAIDNENSRLRNCPGFRYFNLKLQDTPNVCKRKGVVLDLNPRADKESIGVSRSILSDGDPHWPRFFGLKAWDAPISGHQTKYIIIYKCKYDDYVYVRRLISLPFSGLTLGGFNLFVCYVKMWIVNNQQRTRYQGLMRGIDFAMGTTVEKRN
jgi:hypothetical protein